MRVVRTIVLVLIGLVIAGVGFLWLVPPDLIRVGANYSAKIVCSNVFLAGRDAEEVLAVDVQAPGHPLLRLMRVDVDESAGTVDAGLFGLFGGGLAVHRTGAGCTTVADGNMQALGSIQLPAAVAEPDDDAIWPAGNAVEPVANAELDAVLDDPDLIGPGMRAIVVVKDGKIIAERYGEGFDAETPLLGWSMTKTVSAAIVGRMVREGRMTLDQTLSYEGWDGDGRADITVTDMLGMAPDLTWNEGYGSVSDVTRMLYLEPDMAEFVAGQPIDNETAGGPGEAFNYSSGTSVLLSRVWQESFSDPDQAYAYPRTALFDPLGMQSAVMEMDARDTFVGSSYMYATARDWARFGQFMLQRGVWEGQSLLPVGYVDWMVEAHPASGGQYGNGHLWLRAPNAWMPGDNAVLPADAYFLSGHDGQSITVVPSQDLVVVRLGLTPSSQGYKVSFLVAAIIEALRQ